MGEQVSVPIDLIVLADRLRTAAAEMTDENRHDWAFLVTTAADSMSVASREIKEARRGGL